MKKILVLCLALSMVFVAACGGAGGGTTPPPAPPAGGSAAAETPAPAETPAEQIVMRLAEIHSADYPTTLGNFEFARLVEERTDGRIRIEVFPGGQLGDETAVVQELLMGTIEFARVSVSPATQFSPGLNAIMLPFIYRDSDHMWAVLNGPIGTQLLEQVEAESGALVGLTWYDAGARSFYTSEPLATAADFAGLQFRMQDAPLMQGIVTSLNASPVSMGMGDVFQALSTGMVDGAENNIPSFESWNHFEVAPYLLLTEHSRVPEILMASKVVLDGLSAEDQQIIRQAAHEAQIYQRARWIEREEYSLNVAQGNPDVTITALTPEQRAEFVAAVEPLIIEFGAGHEELIEQIRNTQ
jgi:tripartite ATP-independent transporter DctP family solute receptor